jgi:parallel beta-helix repeat protein
MRAFATSNTVSNAEYAILDAASTSSISIKSNLVLNSTYFGIYLVSPTNATVELNTITKAPVGIEFSCSAGLNTVKSNIISDVTTDLDRVPLSVASVNTYDNVDTIRTGGCGFARIPAPPLLPLP